MSNNADQLIAYPIIKEIAYRSKMDSVELNEMLRSLEESVLRSLLRGTKLSERVNMLNLAVNSAYVALSKSQQSYTAYPTTTDITSATSFVGSAYATAFGEVNGVRQNKTAGIVTMDWNDNKKLSKIPVYEGVVSPNIKIYVDNILRPSDDPVYSIIDGDNSTFWVESTTTGQHTLEIVLPPSVQKTFNYLEMTPFPLFGMNIKQIQYTDLHNKAQVIYPTSENSFYSPGGPLMFHLQPREYNNSIKIVFEVLEGIGAMGFTLIDICNIDYLNNTNTVYLKFENIPEYDVYGTKVTEITPVSIDIDFYVDGHLDNTYDNFITDISLAAIIGNATTMGLARTKGYQTIPATSIVLGTVDGKNSLYLKFVINEIGLTTPVIRGAKLNYTYGTIV